jgi:ketosteroid isomerase-like protein
MTRSVASENVEMARAWFDAWNRTDWGALEELTDRNIVMVAPDDWPEGGTFFGWDEARAQWERLKEPWDEERGEGYEFLEADDKVLVLFRWVGIGNTSDMRVETAMSCLMTPRGGKMARLEFFVGSEDGRQAMGDHAS